jgi:hypothetical protein
MKTRHHLSQANHDLMCGGKDPSPPPAVRLHDIAPRPAESRRAPPPSRQRAEPPVSSHQQRGRRPPGSSQHPQRPSTSDAARRQKPRPTTAGPSSHRDRPGSSRKERRPSSASSRPKTSRQREPKRGPSRIGAIPEHTPVQYTEDQTIIDRVAELHTLIDQHVENFYRSNGAPGGRGPDDELNDPATRYGMIRYRIAREIIKTIIEPSSERSAGRPSPYLSPANRAP